MMEALLERLSSANAFSREHKHAQAYYEYVQATHEAIELSLKAFSAIPMSVVNRLFEFVEKCLERAEGLVSEVLDLSDEEADKLSLERLSVREFTQTSQFVDSTNNNKDTCSLPLIQMSSLQKALYTALYELQLEWQQWIILESASAKQRSNVLYLEKLRMTAIKLENIIENIKKIQDNVSKIEKLSIRGLNPEELAQQLTLVYFDALQRVDLTQPASFHEINDLSKYIGSWIKGEIFNCKNEMDRTEAMAKLIRMCHFLAEYRNWEGCLLFINTLTSPPMQSLECNNKVGSRLMKRMENLRVLCSAGGRYMRLRQVIAEDPRPCIPPLILYHYGDYDGRMEEFQGKLVNKENYSDLFKINPSIQHFLLTRPYQTEEELSSIASSNKCEKREIFKDGPHKDYSFEDDLDDTVRDPDKLDEASLARLNQSLSNDAEYDILSRDLRRRRSGFVRPSYPNNIPSPTKSSLR